MEAKPVDVEHVNISQGLIKGTDRRSLGGTSNPSRILWPISNISLTETRSVGALNA